MREILVNIKYRFKMQFSSKANIFWQFINPIILMLLFYIAFSGLLYSDSIESFSVSMYKDNIAREVFEDIDFIDINIIDNNISGKESLDDGLIFIDNDLNMIVHSNGQRQLIVKDILDEFKEGYKMYEQGKEYNSNLNFIKNENQLSSPIYIIFYGLMSMIITHSMNTSLGVSIGAQANLSEEGARLNISPVKKSNLIISGVFVSLIINLVSNIILIIFTNKILRLNIFPNIPYTILIAFIGNIFGVSLGVLIGGSNTQDRQFKSMLALGINMFLSGISGMLSDSLRRFTDNIFPIINRYNPMAIIADNLYRVNLDGNYIHLTKDMAILLLYSLLSICISYFLLRRRRYESI